MTSPMDKIAAFHALNPTEFPILVLLEIQQIVERGLPRGLNLSLELARESNAQSHLLLRFEGVTDLRIDWPDWSLVRLDVIEVTDISGRGIEDARFRVSEGSGLFAFSCAEFHGGVR
jgi:hypothetical protein